METMFQIMLRDGELDAELTHMEWQKLLSEGNELHRADELMARYLVDIAIKPPPTPQESEKTRSYLAQRSEIQVALSSKPRLVPAFKFRSNDQLHVIPAE